MLNRGLNTTQRSAICRYLLLGWNYKAIAEEVGVSLRSVERYQHNLIHYGSVRKPRFRTLGRAHKLSKADEEALLEYLLKEGWRQQEELVWWLYHERDVAVSRSTVSRTLTRRKWSRKALKRISQGCCEDLRRLYLDDIRQFTAEDLVFIDESIFNEKTGWRYHGYAPIGNDARIQASIQRGSTWSICSAMTIDGWLSCTGIKQGYFKADDFFE